jgi:uncharacterized protein
MLFVFDTNTLVSALLKPQGVPAQALLKALQIGKIVFSTETETEYLDVVRREKFNKYLPSDERLQSARRLIEKSERKVVSINLGGVCRDANDVKFLNLALEWNANCIITGDKDLLVLNPFRTIPIATPADFLSMR